MNHKYGTELEFTCDDPTQLFEMSPTEYHERVSSICQWSEQWSRTTLPACKCKQGSKASLSHNINSFILALMCTAPMSLDSSNIEHDFTGAYPFFGQLVNYTCHNGHRFDHDFSSPGFQIECQDDGLWTGPEGWKFLRCTKPDGKCPSLFAIESSPRTRQNQFKAAAEMENIAQSSLYYKCLIILF